MSFTDCPYLPPLDPPTSTPLGARTYPYPHTTRDARNETEFQASDFCQ